MDRPSYETAHDLAMEGKHKESLEAALGGTARKMPRSYRFDFAIFDAQGALSHIVEFKHRPVNYIHYSSIILSAGKFNYMMQFAMRFSVPAWFFVRFNDGLYSANLQLGWPVRWGGRTDRKDWQDQEPVVHIPREAFSDIADRHKLEKL